MELETQFNSFYPRIKAMSLRYSKDTRIPADDFESELCEAFYRKFEVYDALLCDNFTAYILVELKKRAIDVIRSKYGKSWQRLDYLEDKLPVDYEGYNAVEVLVVDDANTESTAIDRVVIGDKRQLIYSLLDETTTPIVEELIATDDSIKRVSERLGIHQEKARRALRKLRKRYDAKKFGDYRAYIA